MSIPKISPYSLFIGDPLLGSPTPRCADTPQSQPAVVAVWPCMVLLLLRSCVLLYSLRGPRPLDSLHSVFVLLQSPPFPALLSSAVVILVCACLLLAPSFDDVFAASSATITKHSRLSGVYTPKFAYDSLLLFELIHHSTASTAVVWWKGLDRSLRTACTAVFQPSLHLLENLRAVSTTANIIFWDIVGIEAYPPLPPIITPPDADALISPRRHPPLPPIFTPPDTDTWQPSTCLRAPPPLPPIITPLDTNDLSHRTLAAQIASATFPSKLGCLLANATAGPERYLDKMPPRISPVTLDFIWLGIASHFRDNSLIYLGILQHHLP